jgi:hypothetical protein
VYYLVSRNDDSKEANHQISSQKDHLSGSPLACVPDLGQAIQNSDFADRQMRCVDDTAERDAAQGKHSRDDTNASSLDGGGGDARSKTAQGPDEAEGLDAESSDAGQLCSGAKRARSASVSECRGEAEDRDAPSAGFEVEGGEGLPVLIREVSANGSLARSQCGVEVGWHLVSVGGVKLDKSHSREQVQRMMRGPNGRFISLPSLFMFCREVGGLGGMGWGGACACLSSLFLATHA